VPPTLTPAITLTDTARNSSRKNPEEPIAGASGVDDEARCCFDHTH
jgi:hypothetical protein